MNQHDNQCGLWKKDGNNGQYYSGKITVGGVEYWANLYKNDRKESDRHPDLNLKLKPVDGGKAQESRPRPAPKPAPADDFQSDDITF